MEDWRSDICAKQVDLHQPRHQGEFDDHNTVCAQNIDIDGSHIEINHSGGGRTTTNPILWLETRPHAAPNASNRRNRILYSHSSNPPPCTNIGNVSEHQRTVETVGETHGTCAICKQNNRAQRSIAEPRPRLPAAKHGPRM